MAFPSDDTGADAGGFDAFPSDEPVPAPAASAGGFDDFDAFPEEPQVADFDAFPEESPSIDPRGKGRAPAPPAGTCAVVDCIVFRAWRLSSHVDVDRG